MEDALSTGEVAQAAGTSPAVIDALARNGIIRHTDGRYRPSDVSRARLVLSLEASGIGLGEIGEAVRTGRLSLAFVDELMPAPVRLLRETQGEVLRRQAVSPALSQRIRALLGSSDARDDEPMRQDDAELFAILGRATALGADDDHVARVLIAFTENLRRIVDAQRDFIDEVLVQPAIASLGSPTKALEATSSARVEFRALGRALLGMLHDRIVEDAIFQNLVQLTEGALAVDRPAHPGAPPAIAFVDVVGYTRLTEEGGDQAAASQATRLLELARRLAEARSGRLVKFLGDGVMLWFPSPTPAVLFVLDATEEAERRGIAKLHAGVNAGPVVRRDGDYFGTTVNVASRAAEHASAGETLVTQRVVDAWEGGHGIRFQPLAPAAMKNVARPVPLYRATRAGDAAR
jgi:adenylate cyclase